jgi:hypothetical protein
MVDSLRSIIESAHLWQSSSSPNQVGRGCEIVTYLDVKFHGESKNAIRSWKILTFGGDMAKIHFQNLYLRIAAERVRFERSGVKTKKMRREKYF